MPAKKRRTPDLDPSVAAALAAKPAHAPKKPKRARASYDMKPETIQAIKDIARDLEVPIHMVHQKLLDYALQAYEGGDLELKRAQVVVTKWGLE